MFISQHTSLMLTQVPPPPGSTADVKFEVIPEAGEGAEGSAGDRATVYKRLQAELIQQTRVSIAAVVSSCCVLHCVS